METTSSEASLTTIGLILYLGGGLFLPFILGMMLERQGKESVSLIASFAGSDLLFLPFTFLFWPVWATIDLLVLLGYRKGHDLMAAQATGALIEPEPDPTLAELVGQYAEASTAMRPQGTILIGGRHLAAHSRSGYLRPRTSVRIVEFRSGVAFVEENRDSVPR